MFLTGEPGSGKTHTINQYVRHLRSAGIEPAITASTGIAATHIGGMTIHAWSGIGVKNDLSVYDLDAISQNRNVVRRVGEARVLVVDEISMLSARTFAMVDAVCRAVRRNQDAFGGLQTILVGDFFQLPPVSRREDDEQSALDGDRGDRDGFAYESSVWQSLNLVPCYLTEQHRQEDGAFLDFLSAIRARRIGEQHKQLLRTRYSPKVRDGITELYTHNADVDAVNSVELGKLSGEQRLFLMESHGPEKLILSLKRGCLSPERLVLKVGAKVMFTRNDPEQRYANGTLGDIRGFDGAGFPIVRTNTGRTVIAEPDEWHIEDGGRVLARITQIPLRLSWAMTVHKSQGMSLDAAHMDLSQVFEYGQGYVALSRVRTLAGLSIAGLSPRALEVHPDVAAKDMQFRAQSDAARDTFARMSRRELDTLHTNFIRAMGGTPGMGRKQKKPKADKGSTLDATLALIARKLSFEDMAQERGMTVGTIISHCEQLATLGKIDPSRDLAHIPRDQKRVAMMHAALKKTRFSDGSCSLSAARAALKNAYSYDELKLARLLMPRQ